MGIFIILILVGQILSHYLFIFFYKNPIILKLFKFIYTAPNQNRSYHEHLGFLISYQKDQFLIDWPYIVHFFSLIVIKTYIRLTTRYEHENWEVFFLYFGWDFPPCLEVIQTWVRGRFLLFGSFYLNMSFSVRQHLVLSSSKISMQTVTVWW